jgi:hypothetical protein
VGQAFPWRVAEQVLRARNPVPCLGGDGWGKGKEKSRTPEQTHCTDF